MKKFEKTKGERKSMQNKQNTKAKVIVIAIAILLCLALAVGITGAFYQAQRRATGTVKMDKGIVIDYTGFGKTPNEGTWLRETTISFKLFEDADVQPGEKISLNDAGIKANASSVDFYARVKLSYEFYNVVGDVETPVALANPSDLITTSATFFGADWVKSNDGYHYYATGTTLNKFTKATPATFVDLFDTNAQFIIEGAGFTGAYPDGEGGGYVVDETTSINKIVVYLTLETLQGDADAAAEGWKIVSEVDFSKVSAENASIVTSGSGTPVEETLNVTINDVTTNLSEVKFPYDTSTTLEFNSKNVEYVELIYSDDTTEKFYELAASEESATKYSQIQLTADSSKGTITGYTVGLFGASEYTGFKFTTTGYDDNGSTYEIANGVSVTGYYGSDTEIEIQSSYRVRERDFKVVVKDTNANDWAKNILPMQLYTASYPCTLTWYDGSNSKVIGNFANLNEGIAFMESDWMYDHEFDDFTNYEFTFSYSALCETTNIFYSSKEVKEISVYAFMYSACTSITLPETITKIQPVAFQGSSLTIINIPASVTTIGGQAFANCNNLTTTIGDGWVKASDSSAVDASTLLKDITYSIKRT